ncbi:hypothetical protein UVI_02037510 [Ustilaginoidea virens]|uniref:Uncharacterized protein n=1 Tax=Ustilaginoidea virens TaxID=1159556 RepID=A0A1B5KTB8_USTVR|nr:hypothetical protein UVI_02037510 [Ustilaginoidea virens]
MGDYQNCMPPPTGVNFQPPAPDTTFGPIPHVYVPRFDGVPVAGLHVGLPPPCSSYALFASHPATAVYNLPLPTYYATPTPLTTTVVTPKTFHVNGHTYYATFPVAQQGYVGIAQPSYVPLAQPQPVVINGQAYVSAPGIPGQPMMAPPVMATPGGGIGVAPAGAIPIIPGNASSNIPDVAGVGRTPNEETLRQVEFAYNNRLFEPQDFKPADDDPSRFYYVREVDGNWTQRNRFTIDHMGNCRWYVTDEGWFYAVRLPD